MAWHIQEYQHSNTSHAWKLPSARLKSSNYLTDSMKKGANLKKIPPFSHHKPYCGWDNKSTDRTCYKQCTQARKDPTQGLQAGNRTCYKQCTQARKDPTQGLQVGNRTCYKQCTQARKDPTQGLQTGNSPKPMQTVAEFWCTPGASIMEADDRQVTTVFTVHRHSIIGTQQTEYHEALPSSGTTR